MRLQRRCETIAESYTKIRVILAELDAPFRPAEDRALEVGIDKIGANGSMRGFLRCAFAASFQQNMLRSEKTIRRRAAA
jgi:hypothetical protein